MTPYLHEPSKMSPDKRLSEISILLARAYIRLNISLIFQRYPLDVSDKNCTHCVQTVNSNGAEPSLEVA